LQPIFPFSHAAWPSTSGISRYVSTRRKKELAEQESRAECWANFTSPQAKGKQQQVASDAVDTTEKEKQPRTELLDDCVTELLGSKLNEVMNQIRFLPSAKQISEAIRSEVRSAVADAFRKEGRTEAKPPKQPAQLSQAASVGDLAKYYDMGHYVGDCAARCKTCCKDGKSKVLIDEDTIQELGVFSTNQKLRNAQQATKRKRGRRKGEGGRRRGKGGGGPHV
jgi:hypothetical protein